MNVLSVSGVATVMTLCSVAVSAGAQSRAAELQAARQALGAYDVEGSATVRVLGDLTSYMGRAADGPSAQEARFLRAVAATDLLVIAHMGALDAVRGRVAEALGVGASDLDAYLAAELRAVSVRHFRPTAQDAETGLKLIAATGPVVWAQHQGLRRDALLVRAVGEQIRANVAPTELFSAFAQDPCGRPGPCGAHYAPFEAQGRRAVAGLEQIAAALRALGEAAENGDPFSSIAPWRRQSEVIEAVVLEPAARIGVLALETAPENRGRAQGLRLVVGVGDTKAVYGYVPRARIREGIVALESDASPALPATAEIDLQSAEGREALASLLSSVADTETESRLGIGGLPSSTGATLGRVLKQARAAGHERVWLVGQGTEETAHGVRLALAADSQPVRGIQMRLRLLEWGYSVMTARGAEAIPRVRVSDGGAYDVGALAASVGGRTFESASLQYHPSATAADIMTAAMQIAPLNNALVVMVP